MKLPLSSFAASPSLATREGDDAYAAGRPLLGISRPSIACISIAMFMASISAHAQSVALTGVLGSKALLVVDGGAPKALAANESHQGVRLLQGGAQLIESGGDAVHALIEQILIQRSIKYLIFVIGDLLGHDP